MCRLMKLHKPGRCAANRQPVMLPVRMMMAVLTVLIRTGVIVLIVLQL